MSLPANGFQLAKSWRWALPWALLIAGLTSPAKADIDIGPYRFEAFECEEGLQHKSVTLKEPEVRLDKCIDVQGRRQGVIRYTRLADESVEGEAIYEDDRKQGPLRLYDEYGFLVHEAMYEADVAVSERYTLRGLQAIAKVANDEFLAKGSAMQIVALDERTLGYEFVVEPRRLKRVGPRQRSAMLRPLCELMKTVPQIERVELEGFTTSGITLRRWHLRASACAVNTAGKKATRPAQ